MAEEFEESDVVFRENSEGEDGNDRAGKNLRGFRKGKRKKTMVNKNCSIPLRIPETVPPRWTSWEVDCGDGEMVPPHVITGRRVAGEMMACSVCTGNGRTLKGRDLSQVRNSILRMTGFIET